MATGEFNPLFESVSGAIGDIVVRHYGTRTVISRRPVFRNRVFSEAQKEAHERFRQATLFAKQLMADPGARLLYEEEARATRKPILSLMIADYFRAIAGGQSSVAIPITRPSAPSATRIPASSLVTHHFLLHMSPHIDILISVVNRQYSFTL